jgi:hypothetical protein
VTQTDRCARHVSDVVIPAMLRRAMAPPGGFNTEAARSFRDRILVQMGNPTDPVEVMAIEQLAANHVLALYLQGCAGLSADDATKTEVYVAAAARLIAEYRRMMLALRDYRSPPPARQVTRIEQQNVATRQQVSYDAGVGEARPPRGKKKAARSKLVGNLDELHNIRSASLRRTKQQTEARAANASRPAALA